MALGIPMLQRLLAINTYAFFGNHNLPSVQALAMILQILHPLYHHYKHEGRFEF